MSSPTQFQELWTQAARRLKPQQEHTRIHALPPSLVRLAEETEQSRVFARFVEHIRDAFGVDSSWRVAQTLRRAGFYHSLDVGSSADAVYARLAAHLTPYTGYQQTH